MSNAQTAIEQYIQQLATTAHRGCGLSYELFVERFSSAVDEYVGALSEDEAEAAMKAARNHGYTSASELSEGWEGRENLCQHRLDPDHCGHGCGEY